MHSYSIFCSAPLHSLTNAFICGISIACEQTQIIQSEAKSVPLPLKHTLSAIHSFLWHSFLFVFLFAFAFATLHCLPAHYLSPVDFPFMGPQSIFFNNSHSFMLWRVWQKWQNSWKNPNAKRTHIKNGG